MPFFIERNDITEMKVDAIVNTAHPSPAYGAGLDTAVYMAAGEEKLLAAREKIGFIDRGSSAVTKGYDLPAKYIIHTVGTHWVDGKSGEEDVVRSCYRNSLKLAVEKKCNTVAFPLLASGCYGFPKGVALRIALSEIESFLMTCDMTVYLVVFDKKATELSTELYGDIDSYIDENYVEGKTREEYPGGPELHRGRGRERLREDISLDLYEDYEISREEVTGPRRLGKTGRAFTSITPMAGSKAKASIAPNFMSDEKASMAAPMKESKASMAAPMGKPKRSLDDIIGNLDKTFMEMVFSFADSKGITDVELQKRANLDKRAFSKLRCGTTKKPSQTTALALAVGLELGLDDTKDLLSRAGLALSPCSKLDLIVQYFIERGIYDINEINFALFEHGEPLLGSQVV